MVDEESRRRLGRLELLRLTRDRLARAGRRRRAQYAQQQREEVLGSQQTRPGPYAQLPGTNPSGVR